MKPILILLTAFFVMSFQNEQKDIDVNHLYKNWGWSRHDFKSKKITYRPVETFGNYFGYQFRKDGTLSICRGVSQYPRDWDNSYEISEGTWKIANDSILSFAFESNGKKYNEVFVISELNEEKLTLHFKK